MFDPNNPQNSFDLSAPGGFNSSPMGGMSMPQGQQGGGLGINMDHIMYMMMMLPQLLQALGVGRTKPIESWGGKKRTVTSPTDITYSK